MAGEQGLQYLILHLIGVLLDVVYLGFPQMEQGAELLLGAFDKLAQGPFLKDPLGGFDDFFQPLTVTLQGADIPIGSQAGPQQGAQLLGGELGFILVVVDVVVGDHVIFRRLAGLAGTQHDAYHLVLQIFTDIFDDIEAGVVDLHHHVQQQQSNVRGGGQQLFGLCRGIGMQKIDGAIVKLEFVQGDFGDAMHFRLIVNNHHLPARLLCVGEGEIVIINNQDLVIHHTILFGILCLH